MKRKMKKMRNILLVIGVAMMMMSCSSDNEPSSDAEAVGDGDVTENSAKDNSEDNSVEETTSSDLRITWWGSQARHNSTIEALDKYVENNDVNLSYEYTSWSSYWETLATQAVGNNLPDIIQMSTTDIVNYSKNNQIISLQPYIDSGVIDLTYVDKSSLSAGTVEGQVTGYPTGVNTVSVVYNKEIFDQAGVDYPKDNWTWSDYLDTAKKIYEATGVQTDIPFLSEARWLAEFIVRSYGYDFYEADGSLGWANDERVLNGLKNAFADIKEMVELGVFVDPEVQIAWATTEDNYIVQGKSAMAFLLSNYYETYSNVLGSPLGICMLPKPDDADKSGMYMNANMYWSISSDCQDPEAAASILNYMVNDMEAMEIILADRGISLSSEIREGLTDVVGEYTANTFDYISSVSEVVEKTNAPDPANAAEAVNVLKVNYQALMYGEMDAEEAIDDFVIQATDILGQ